jgi:hypothetical protein
MRTRRIALTGLLLALSFDLFAIEVGSIADSRFGTGWTLDGSEMTRTRAKLLATANFGPLGAVGEAINITDIAGPISVTALSTFEIFFIGYLNDGSANAFSEEELQAMQDWVAAGGTMVITCDEPGYAAVCTAFGPVPAADDGASPPVVPATAGIFDGPFGSPAELDMSGATNYFSDTDGFTVLGIDQADQPVVLEAEIGDGKVIVFTDVDIISNHTLSEGTGISNDNDRFMGNLFAFLAGEAGETFVINAGLNGNWWYGPERRGEGFQLEVVLSNGNLTLVATFYTYDTNGNQIFLIAVGPVVGTNANVNVFITEGGLWGEDFDPNLVNETQWGTGSFSATSCNTAHMSLSPNAQYQGMGYTNLAYDLKRNTIAAAPCPIANPD